MKNVFLLFLKKNKAPKWERKKKIQVFTEMVLNFNRKIIGDKEEDSIGLFGLEFFRKISETLCLKEFNFMDDFKKISKSSIFILWKNRHSGKTLVPKSIFIFVKGLSYFLKKEKFGNFDKTKTIFNSSEKHFLYSRIKTKFKKKISEIIFTKKETKPFCFFRLVQQKV